MESQRRSIRPNQQVKSDTSCWPSIPQGWSAERTLLTWLAKRLQTSQTMFARQTVFCANDWLTHPSIRPTQCWRRRQSSVRVHIHQCMHRWLIRLQIQLQLRPINYESKNQQTTPAHKRVWSLENLPNQFDWPLRRRSTSAPTVQAWWALSNEIRALSLAVGNSCFNSEVRLDVREIGLWKGVLLQKSDRIAGPKLNSLPMI